jgi:hypothetical protein
MHPYSTQTVQKRRNASSPHFRESFPATLFKRKGKGRKRREKREENLAYLVGVRDQLLQRLHPLRYPLPPELQQTRGQREREDTTETESI